MAGWRFDRSISWGDILLTISLVVGGVMAWAELNARVELAQERITNIGHGQSSLHAEFAAHMEAENARREALRAELKSELRDINMKLDRLIERSK